MRGSVRKETEASPGIGRRGVKHVPGTPGVMRGPEVLHYIP